MKTASKYPALPTLHPLPPPLEVHWLIHLTSPPQKKKKKKKIRGGGGGEFYKN